MTSTPLPETPSLEPPPSATQVTPHLTARGARTRAKLVDAARDLFERQGYIDTSVNDVTAAAGVAYGTFYIYFTSKEGIFDDLIRDHYAEFRSIAASEPRLGTGPAAQIERANRGYLRAYQQTAAMMRILEQVITVNPRLAMERRESNRFWRERSRRAITGWQIDGIVGRDIDAVYAANALGAMVDRFAYLWFVAGEAHDFDIAVEQITHLYCNALGIVHAIDRPPVEL
jgi:AcrR family transcriptional regulator